jgi:hypothetical protein
MSPERGDAASSGVDGRSEGYHLTDDLTDKALEFIKDAEAVDRLWTSNAKPP